MTIYEHFRRKPIRYQYGANMVQIRCQTRFKHGANTVPIRCKHGANTVPKISRCQHGANEKQLRIIGTVLVPCWHRVGINTVPTRCRKKNPLRTMGTVLAPCWQRVGTVSGTVLFWYRIGTVLAPYLHRVGTVFGTVV